MTEELKIKVTADTSDFNDGMDKVGKKVDESAGKAKKADTSWTNFGKKFAAISPTFAKAQKGIGEQSSKISEAFGGSVSSAKLMKLGVIGAVAAIGAKVGQVAWKVGKETARMFDPQGYSKAAGQMQKSIKRLKTTIGSFTAPIVNGIMKGVAKIADGINLILEGVRAVRAFLWGIIKGIIRPIIDAVKTIIDWIKQGISALAGLLGFGDVFKKPAESAKKTADSMGEVVEATSAGLAGFDKLNTLDTGNMGDTEQAEKMSALIDKAGKLGQTIGEKLNFKNIIKELAHFDFGGLWSNVTSGAHNAWSKIKGFGVDAFGKIADFGGESWTWIKGKASDAWHGIKGFGENAWGKIGEKGGEIWHKMLDFGHDFKENVMDKLRAGFDHIKELVEKIKKKVEEIVDKVKEITTGAVGGVKDFVKDPLGGIKHIGGKAVDKVKGLLGFADGGVVKPNNPFPVIVGDNTREPEIISPVSTLQHAVKEAIQSMGGQSAMSGGPIELTVNLDGRKIARAVYDPLKTEARRRGSSI